MNIDDVNYYKDTFKNINIQKIIMNYFKIINGYLSYFSKNIKLEENREFIMKRGINVINNVFNITLMYSKNTDMAIFYSKKAHFLYPKKYIFYSPKSTFFIPQKVHFLYPKKSIF